MKIDKHSDTWKALTERIAAETKNLTEAILRESADVDAAARHRARYWMLQDVISWADEVPVPIIEEIRF